MPSQVEERFDSEQLFRLIQIVPESLEFGDKPDIRFTLDRKRIGLEHTRIDPQEFRRGFKLANKHFQNPIFSSTGLHDDREQRRNNKELIETMLDSDQWEDVSEFMGRWAASCATALITKTAKLNHPDFEKFDENWLLVAGEDGPWIDQVSWNIAPKYLFVAIRQAGLPKPASFQGKQFLRVYFHFDPHLFLLTNNQLNRLAPLIENPVK